MATPNDNPVAGKTDNTVAGKVERILASSVRMDEGRPSVISEGFSFTGDIVSEHTLHVEGHLTGNTTVGAIVVGPNGSLKGTIKCARLLVKGLVEGMVECDELDIESTARLKGTVEYRVLNVQRGAVVTGEMIIHKAPPGRRRAD
jgi:cytoskeletal protein CcmA (bactofilin family)